MTRAAIVAAAVLLELGCSHVSRDFRILCEADCRECGELKTRCELERGDHVEYQQRPQETKQ